MFLNDTFTCWARRTCTLALGVSLIYGAATEQLAPLPEPVEAAASTWDRHEPERDVTPPDRTINASPGATGAVTPGYVERVWRFGLDL